MMKYDNLLLSTSRNSSSKIIPSNYITSASFYLDPPSVTDDKPLVAKGSPITFGRFSKTRTGISNLIRSFLTVVSIPTVLPTCRWLMTTLPASVTRTPSLGRKVTGTLFGNRRGHVSFAVQCDSQSAPMLIIELAVTTAALVKEMASGLVRIALECEKGHRPGTVGRGGKLFSESDWTMYCNGRKCGYSSSRSCSESDWHVLSTVQSVSVGAGVIPVVEGGRKSDVGGGSSSESEGELLYMRASFDRVVGSRDSEAYYMRNPDGSRGPELSIFLLRI